MNESILNHLFLPHYLVSSADADFLIQHNHANEHVLLEHMKEYLTSSFQSSNVAVTLPIFDTLTDCIQRWCTLQNPQTISVSNLQAAIKQLPSGCFLPLYFHAQNAALLIEIGEHNTKQPLISAWQVLLPSADITSSLVPHVSCFPVTAYKLDNRSQLSSRVHCELLMDFMDNTIEYSKSYKASREVDEIRDVPESHYICQWWIQHFPGVQIENSPHKSCQFKKKHRDHIRWNNAKLPFRRSGLWMTIKVVFQTILTKRLGHIGTIIYKLLITHFLTHIIQTRPSSTDLLVHCIRKIVRRLNKIEGKLSLIDSSDLNKWVQYMKQDIQTKINQFLPKADWQIFIQRKEKNNISLLMTNSQQISSEIYQHACLELKAYLNDQNLSETFKLFSDINNCNKSTNDNQADYIPSYNVLTNHLNYTTGAALTRMEIWVDSCLKEWINRLSLSTSDSNRFELLLCFYEEYQNAALNHYWSGKGSTDPMGYSRFILTSLAVIRSMHEKLCNDPRFERLNQHSIDIPNLMNLFEFLILPNREDMIRARSLYDYFYSFNNKLYPDLLTNIESGNAFGVHFASQTSTMNESIRRIRAQAELDKQQKIVKVKNAKQRYTELMNVVNSRSCEYVDDRHSYFCRRCQSREQANSIQVKIFECPIPSTREGALAVIFELQMPIEIRCYRDILWQFANRPNRNPNNGMYEWLSVPPHNSKLGPFYTGPSNHKVRLVSSTQSATQTHYSYPPSITSTPVEGFLFENSLKVQISPTKPTEFENERRILTPQLDHADYKQLQFTVDTTQFVQNRVIAKLSECSPRLRPNQFVEFGSFRSGHRLQWWNLFPVFEMDSLSIAEESVVILIIHSILQYGPLSTDLEILNNHWCTESHQQLLEDYFVDELLSRLDRHLGDCELNWQNELVLVVITMITMRILTICNSTKKDQVVDLAIKCRRIGEKWIDLISESIQTIFPSAFNEIKKLRSKMVNIGVSCLLTFSTHQDRISCLLSSNEHVISLLKAATTVHDNIILNKDHSNMSTFMRNLMRYSERVLVMIQPTIAEFLKNTSYQSLNEFAAIYWAVIGTKGKLDGQWKKRNEDSYDGWYYCQYGARSISIDCVRGTFLVDGTTIGFLPENITSNELFVRVFGDHIFEVQAAELPNTYVTKHPYHGSGRVQYEFHFNDQNKRLTITEQHISTHDVFQLIPHSCFKTELPDVFVSNHSHWWNAKEQTVAFRPVCFEKPDFLDNKPYMLTLTTGYVMTTDTTNTQILINQSSSFFHNLFTRYFVRLDDKSYIYMMRDNTDQTDTVIHIHSSRLGVAFQYSARTNIITSREYSDMCIDNDQWLGTLTGLTFGLLLSPLPVNNQKLEHYPYRKLIVPFGEIHGTKKNANHQIITVQRSSSTPFLHQYFVFIMNDRLKILQSTDSPTGWLYLALLHAMTSHPLPDQYTEMTGMERAFQLLNSAGCWSNQPFDALSLNILGQIAAISPKVNYYPEHLICMEKIDWNSNGLPCSMQHFAYYLIAKKLIETSEQLSFMYPSSIAKRPEIFKGKVYNERLLSKLYWNYRDSYNPVARLSEDMEAVILGTLNKKSYQSTPEHYWHAANYRADRLVDDLYKSGSVNLTDCSNQHWLPLCQWLSLGIELKNIWIGLLKMTDCVKISRTENSTDEIERFEKMIDFLHYISDKLNIKPFYLQMLKTALKIPTTVSTFITYPLFIEYSSIEQISVATYRIGISSSYSSSKRDRIIAEIENCFCRDLDYKDRNNLTTDSEKTQINQLLKSWQNNRQLRTFLETVESRICTVPIEQFYTKIPYYSQQFVVESVADHYQIQLRSTKKLIDQKLLQNAKQRFHCPYSGHFNKPRIPLQTINRQKPFPRQIFADTNSKANSLREIGNYFKNQLDQSWKKLLLDEQTQKEDPSINEINECLDRLQEESAQSWHELATCITESNELLFASGLALRITPTTLISLFLQKTVKSNFTANQHTLLGGILVCWTLEQQLQRALHFVTHNKLEDFKKEISSTPHSNWTPSEHVPWLILELEMNITIRETQIKVARHMMQPNMTTDSSTIQSIVMQMNMGEGKTSVILPMLAVSLSSSHSSLVRIVVLKSLFPTNYQSLRYKLGDLLNRRIFPFACRRDMNFNTAQINRIYHRFQQGLSSCDVILTSPEDILSFDLLTIDKCRRNEFDTGRSMLTTQRWLKTYARDILDESDEILHVKYQLIYTVGSQQQVDGGAERWKTIQSILDLVKKHAADISNRFNDEVCYKAPKGKSAFPQFRLQSHKPFPLLCRNIANDWIYNRNYRDIDKQIILPFILETDSSVENLVDKFPLIDIQLFLIIRGLLSSEVLLVALKKRYRVNYGVNPNISCNRLLAVPFRAKDVVADRTEFGHPDVALVLTQLSYYYSGLSDEQLHQCLNRLSDEETDPASIYDQWILYEDTDDIPPSIKQWKGVNLKDYQQRTRYLFPTLRYNMLVINYFLNHFVFPREAKQFPHKLVSSAWDLSSSARSKSITGFSGTNDTQLLLPVHIRQYDLPELQKTDAVVVNNLLQTENESYQFLPINATSNEILNQIVKYGDIINVILDVGALFIDGTNRDIAVKWMNLSNRTKIHYAVYFDSDSIFVCDRQFHHHRFDTSPASERLDRCVFYLDEIHTRGTDFKFPKGFRAAVTLGNGLTKDRFVQACMRMRKLGNGHSLIFWSSHEVHQQITGLKKDASLKNQEDDVSDDISLIDILRWVYENTILSTWDGLHHWAAQSLSFQRKVAAFRAIEWQNHQQSFTDEMMERLAGECLEPEIIELIRMYGPPKVLHTVFEIHSARYQSIDYQILTEIHDAVLERLRDYGGTKQRLSQLLDEEQQRELEQELEEERQLARPPPVIPCEPTLHEQIKRLCNEHGDMMNLSVFPLVFQPLAYAFTGTSFFSQCQPNSWQLNLWISTEFQRVILTKGESLNPFLRPPRWTIVYRNRYIIFVSALEANWLLGRLKCNGSSITTLRLLLPRTKRSQSTLINTPTLTIPPLVAPLDGTTTYFIPIEQLVQLFIFNGTLYFESVDEQTNYCQCLGLCPKPRTTVEKAAFERGWIAVDGFVGSLDHRHYLRIDQARFKCNPLPFVKQLIENRNNSYAPITSHVGSIILNSSKLI